MNPGRPLASLFACVMLLAACGSPADEPTGSADTSASPSDRPQTPATSPSAEASPSASAGSVNSWSMTASFDTDPGTTYAADVTAWSSGFVAIGSAWEGVGHVTQEMPAIWTSADGESWDEQAVELGTDDVSLAGIATLPDGGLLLVGTVPGTGAMPEQPVPAAVAWVSDDGSAWQDVDLPMAEGLPVNSFDHGPMGYAIGAGGAIWFSADGMEWTQTYEGAAGVVAGDEGFVATLTPPTDSPNTFIASADGQTWLPSAPIEGTLLDVAALGGDWVATAYVAEPHTITVWHSENGLDWAPVLDVNDLTGPDGPKTGRGLGADAVNGASVAGGAGYAFLTLTNNHCCAQMSWNYGVWGSSDGTTWEPVVEGDAFVSSVSSNDDATVLAGHLRRGEDAAFWIGDR